MTYTKTFLICPHCGFKTNSTVSHLRDGFTFGPWYCEDCGGGFKGIAKGENTALIKVESRFDKTLDLLVLKPTKHPIYFVMSGREYRSGPDKNEGNQKFFYESHSCPTNWIGRAVMISNNGDTDPHGFLKFVRSTPMPVMPDDAMEGDQVIINLMPEVIQVIN